MMDETFGEIDYEDGWKGPYSYAIFGKDYAVTLVVPCDEGDEIEPAQREAFVRFEQAKAALTGAAARAIFDHYQDIAGEVRERVGPDAAADMAPEIASVDELARIVSPTEVLVQQSFGSDERIIGLLFDCSWDPSLGLAVKFEDERIVEVGNQDIVL